MEPVGIVIRLEDIVRACELLPVFTTHVNRMWTSDLVLDQCEYFHVNNHHDGESFQMIY